MVAKRFCFSLTEEEKAQPSKPVGFAAKVPSIEKVHDEFKDDDSRMKRQALITIIDQLWRNPGVVHQCQSWLAGRIASMSKSSPDDEFKSVSVLRVLDEQWAVIFLISNFSISVGSLEAVCKTDPDAWRQILMFGMNAGMNLKFPPVCKSKAVMGKTLLMRLEECGNRLNGITDRNLRHPTTGCVDWRSLGVYEVVFVNKEQHAKEIKHRPTGFVAAIPAHIVITTAFVLEHNFSDKDAVVVFAPASYALYDFFPEGAGPKKVLPIMGSSKRFDTMAAEAHQEINSSTSERMKRNAPKARFNEAAKKAAKQQNLLKAREALTAKKADTATKRKIKLT